MLQDDVYSMALLLQQYEKSVIFVKSNCHIQRKPCRSKQDIALLSIGQFQESKGKVRASGEVEAQKAGDQINLLSERFLPFL